MWPFVCCWCCCCCCRLPLKLFRCYLHIVTSAAAAAAVQVTKLLLLLLRASLAAPLQGLLQAALLLLLLLLLLHASTAILLLMLRIQGRSIVCSAILPSPRLELSTAPLALANQQLSLLGTRQDLFHQAQPGHRGSIPEHSAGLRQTGCIHPNCPCPPVAVLQPPASGTILNSIKTLSKIYFIGWCSSQYSVPNQNIFIRGCLSQNILLLTTDLSLYQAINGTVNHPVISGLCNPLLLVISFPAFQGKVS